MRLFSKASLVLIFGVFFCLPVFANHHGTRCPIDLEQYQNVVVNFLHQQSCTKELTAKQLMDIAKDNLSAIEDEVAHEHHHLPARGLAYSIPLSFATCQVNLRRKCCPAVQWCYPLGSNKVTLRCGKLGEAIPCGKELKYCKEHPKAPQCIQPSSKLESCLVKPEQKGCKGLIKKSLEKK